MEKGEKKKSEKKKHKLIQLFAIGLIQFLTEDHQISNKYLVFMYLFLLLQANISIIVLKSAILIFYKKRKRNDFIYKSFGLFSKRIS